MNWYRINYKRLTVLLLPTMLRKPVLVALLESLVTPVSGLYTRFLSFSDDVRYRLNHNSQVCYLQAVLNDAFDFSARRIYITDAKIIEWSRFLWLESEDKPIMLQKGEIFILNSERFIGADSLDFIVNVPLSLNLTDNDYNRTHALLRYYKLAGKRYDIEEYE